MPIFSARHKCPVCGREWMMPVNTGDPAVKDQQKPMKDGREYLSTVCGGCQGKRSADG